MKYIFLSLVLILFVKAELLIRKLERCECAKLMKSDCDTQFECKWTGAACEKKSCSDYSTEDKCVGECSWRSNKCTDGKKTCKDMPTEQSCSNLAKCGWKNGACIYFTQCKDFVVSKAEICNALVGEFGQFCQPQEAAITTGKLSKHLVTATPGVQCVDKVYLDCTKFKTAATCKGDATAKAKCQWKNDGKCYPFQLRYCSDATGFPNTLCDPIYCKSSGSFCLNRSCEDFTTQATCTFAPLINKNFVSLCQWKDNKCILASDTSFLTQSTCNTATFGTYHWVVNTTQSNSTITVTDAGACTQCKGLILSIIFTLFAMIFV